MPKSRRILIEKTITKRYGVEPENAPSASAPAAKDVRVRSSTRQVKEGLSSIIPRRKRRSHAEKFVDAMERQ